MAFSNLVLIQWGKSNANGFQTLTLPITYTTVYIGLTTTVRNNGATADEGGNGFCVVDNSTCKVSPCSYIYKVNWLTIGF